VEKTRRILSNAKAKIRSVIADSQYSDRKLREAVAQTVIPYPSNQNVGLKAYCGWIRSSELMDLKNKKVNITRDRPLKQ